MQLFINSYTIGTIVIEIDPKKDNIESIKQMIYEQEGIEINRQVLFWRGKIFDENHPKYTKVLSGHENGPVLIIR